MKTISGAELPRGTFRHAGESMKPRVLMLEVGQCLALEAWRARGSGLNAASLLSKRGKRYTFRMVTASVLGLSKKEQAHFVRECGRVATIWRIR